MTLVLMTGTFGLQKVNERLIGLTQASCGPRKIVEDLKKLSA